MTDFASHNYSRSIDLLSPAIEMDPRFTLALKSGGRLIINAIRKEDADRALRELKSRKIRDAKVLVVD